MYNMNMMGNSSMSGNAAGAGFFAVFLPVVLIVVVYMCFVLWKLYGKAGRPGWAAIVPFYSTYVMIKIAGRPGWWLILLFIPVVNVVVWIMIYLSFAKAFGRSAVFGFFGLFLFGVIGFSILAFGKSRYVLADGPGPDGGSGPSSAPSAPTSPTPPAVAPSAPAMPASPDPSTPPPPPPESPTPPPPAA